MANPYDWLGDIKDYWMKSSLQVYTDLSGLMQYVGKTENEKTFIPNIETIDWWDNSSGTQTRYILDIDKITFDVNFMFRQVLDPNVVAVATNGEWDNSDPNVHRIFFGSNPDTLQEAKWLFVGEGRSGLGITLVIRKGICLIDGEWTVGTAGEYTGIPVKVVALQDTNITNTLRDIAYFEIDKYSAS